MVDTKDSKSFVSDGVRVQVSSPVSKVVLNGQPFFFLNLICKFFSIRNCFLNMLHFNF